MNGPSILEVDAAIRAVLAEFGAARAIGPANFADRLFALRHAEALAEGTREICIAPGTVVTPLARDHLKRLGITIRIISRDEAERQKRDGEWGFAIEDNSGTTAALRRLLLDGPASWVEIGRNAIEAACWVAESPWRGAVLLTPEASVASWQANGIAGVRAATVAEAEAVERALRHLGVNLLVIEPAGKPIFLIKNLVATFRRGGAPMPPPGLERPASGGVDRHADRRGDWPGHPLTPAPEPAERALRDRLALAARGPDRGLLRSG